MSKAYFNSFCYFADKDVYVYIIILQLVYDHVGYQIKYKFVPFQIHLMIWKQTKWESAVVVSQFWEELRFWDSSPLCYVH